MTCPIHGCDNPEGTACTMAVCPGRFTCARHTPPNGSATGCGSVPPLAPRTNTVPCVLPQPTLTSGCEGQPPARNKRRQDRRLHRALRMAGNGETYSHDAPHTGQTA